MNSIYVPLILGLELMAPDSMAVSLEQYGTKFSVNTVNWEAEFPYAPLCQGTIARSEDCIVINFHVKGLDLRAVNLNDNGNQWEDSCCEFFVLNEGTGEYSNFEINCRGKILSEIGADRHNRRWRSEEEMSKIIRVAGEYPAEAFNYSEGVYSWDVTVAIPFSILGFDKNNLPKSVKANFFKCGDKTAHPHFVTWNPVTTPQPDFHRPEFFGELLFEK